MQRYSTTYTLFRGEIGGMLIQILQEKSELVSIILTLKNSYGNRKLQAENRQRLEQHLF